MLAAEPRCLAAVDIETRQPVPAPLRLHLAAQPGNPVAAAATSTPSTDVDAPCLVPGSDQVPLPSATWQPALLLLVELMDLSRRSACLRTSSVRVLCITALANACSCNGTTISPAATAVLCRITRCWAWRCAGNSSGRCSAERRQQQRQTAGMRRTSAALQLPQLCTCSDGWANWWGSLTNLCLKRCWGPGLLCCKPLSCVPASIITHHCHASDRMRYTQAAVCANFQNTFVLLMQAPGDEPGGLGFGTLPAAALLGGVSAAAGPAPADLAKLGATLAAQQPFLSAFAQVRSWGIECSSKDLFSNVH